MPQKPPPAPKKRRPTPQHKLAPLPVDDPTPPPGPGHLPPIPRETAAEHRGFLLWAMQSPDRRSMRAVSRAIDVGDITIRRWKQKRRWDERVAVEASDRLAWQEYLGRYVELYGTAGIGLIQPLMDVQGPLSPLAVIRARLGPDSDARAYPAESASRRVLEAAAEMSRQVMGDPIHDPDPEAAPEPPEEVEVLEDEDGEDLDDDEASEQTPAQRRAKGSGRAGSDPNPAVGNGGRRGGSAPAAPVDDPQRAAGDPKPEAVREEAADPAKRRARVEDYKQLIRGTLGVYAKDLVGGKVKVTPRDAVLLIELEQALAEAPKTEGGRGPVESVRVRTARENGDDLLDAIGQDLAEQAVILSALRQKRAQEVAHLTQELGRRQATSQVG